MPGLVNATSDALARHFARARIFATLSEDRAKGVAPYMSAPTVARDMLEITKAHGLNKLQYWGVSYGTALGMTLVLFLLHVIHKNNKIPQICVIVSCKN